MKTKLRKLRINAEISQGQMAKKLGISRNAYFLKEKGETQFTISEVNAICVILDVDFNEIDWSKE